MRLVPASFMCLAALSLQAAPIPQKAVPASNMGRLSFG